MSAGTSACESGMHIVGAVCVPGGYDGVTGTTTEVRVEKKDQLSN